MQILHITTETCTKYNNILYKSLRISNNNLYVNKKTWDIQQILGKRGTTIYR